MKCRRRHDDFTSLERTFLDVLQQHLAVMDGLWVQLRKQLGDAQHDDDRTSELLALDAFNERADLILELKQGARAGDLTGRRSLE